MEKFQCIANTSKCIKQKNLNITSDNILILATVYKIIKKILINRKYMRKLN